MGVYLKRPLIRRPRLIELSEHVVLEHPLRVPRLGQVGIQLDRHLELLHRRRRILQLGLDPHVVVEPRRLTLFLVRHVLATAEARDQRRETERREQLAQR